MNPALALMLAWRRLTQHPVQSLTTLLGVALGLTAAAAILIVDHNSRESPVRAQVLPNLAATAAAQRAAAAAPKRILRVGFERGDARLPDPRPRPIRALPSQEGRAAAGVSPASPPPRRGEEDYQVMRLAVRLASLMAFGVGAVIVFYSMRFAVVTRTRELMLLVCLGERRANLALSLSIEATSLGLGGSLVGLAAGHWAGHWLLESGISTTGRTPQGPISDPVAELAVLGVLGLTIALLGLVGPLRGLARIRIVDALQPRFASADGQAPMRIGLGLGWIAPPLMLAFWLAARPFLQDWLSVLQFFLIESMVAILVAVGVLWWMRPVLQGAIRLAEWMLGAMLPMEALLAGRRLRLSAGELMLSITAVSLVFAFVVALGGLTRSLKQEIRDWSATALEPSVFLRRQVRSDDGADALMEQLREGGVYPLRLSRKVGGELPMRLVHAGDANAYLAAQGRPLLGPGHCLVSKIMAARFDLAMGDRVVIDTDGGERHRFTVVEVADDLGFFAEDGQYVDLRSWILFDGSSRLFSGNLDTSLGERLSVRRLDGRSPSSAELRPLRPWYGQVDRGHKRARWQIEEIDRDFSIFDFILALTLALAAVGVANTLLIQVLARRRELAVLRTLGVSRAQTIRLVVTEGAVIGVVSALFALLLGLVLAAISVAFLDRFTLFEYNLTLSWTEVLGALVLCVASCSLAALYPAFAATRVSSAESLHYE